MKLSSNPVAIFIQGNAIDSDLEHKVFNIACFSACVLNFFLFLANFFAKTIQLNLLIPFVGFLIYSLVFFFARRILNYRPLFAIFITITQLYISFFWFHNSGSQGVMPLILAGVYMIYLISASYKHYLLITSLVLLNTSLVLYEEYMHPEWISNFSLTETRYIESTIIYGLTMVCMGMCMYFFKKAFEEERNRDERNSFIMAETKSEIKIKKIIENSTDAVITTDVDGTVLEWNKSATKIFNFEAKFAKGKRISELIIPVSVKENFENAVNYFKEKTNFIRFETAAINGNGEIFPVELSMTQIEYEDKIMLNFFIRNIKEIKESEERILKKNKQLLELNEEMDAFIYRSSHDLRTPITNISGLLDIYKYSDEDEKEEIIVRTKSNIERLIKILDDLSNYSKNHRNEISHTLINMTEVVNAVKEKLETSANFDKLVVNITQTGSYDFISDSERLKIILLNLLENALCFRNVENEYVLVDILIEKHGQKAVIRIKDNGEGIKQESLSKIFNMFYRGSVRSTGSGLGLYIVKRILNKIGGTIQVYSQKEVGTEFTIEIPNNLEGILLDEEPVNALHLN